MIIAVDFDGTLVEYHSFQGIGVYGPPIQIMIDRVKKWIAEGHAVVIFTSRVYEHKRNYIANEEHKMIKHWLAVQGLGDLPVTSSKWPQFNEIWDDRAITVERNTGRILTSK